MKDINGKVLKKNQIGIVHLILGGLHLSPPGNDVKNIGQLVIIKEFEFEKVVVVESSLFISGRWYNERKFNLYPYDIEIIDNF